MLNIAFDGKTADELIRFVRTDLVSLTPEEREQINIKVNDLLSEI